MTIIDLLDDSSKDSEKPKAAPSASPPAPSTQSRAPKPEANKVEKPKGVWVISFQYNGAEVKNFPLAWLLHNYTPAVYLNVLKYYGIVGDDATYADAIKGGQTSPLAKFTETLVGEIKSQHPELSQVEVLLNKYIQDFMSQAPETGKITLLKALQTHFAPAMARAVGKPAIEKAIADHIAGEFADRNIADKDQMVSQQQLQNMLRNAASIADNIAGLYRHFNIY